MFTKGLIIDKYIGCFFLLIHLVQPGNKFFCGQRKFRPGLVGKAKCNVIAQPEVAQAALSGGD